MKASLTVEEGGETIRHRCGRRTVVGRDSDCAIVLQNRSVSRKHAVLEPSGDGWLLRDLSSVNGTFVKESRVKEVRLTGGETIRFGDVRAVFELTQEADSGARRLLESLSARPGGRARPMAGFVVALVGILLLLLATVWSKRSPKATTGPATSPTPAAAPPAS